MREYHTNTLFSNFGMTNQKFKPQPYSFLSYLYSIDCDWPSKYSVVNIIFVTFVVVLGIFRKL